MSKKTKNTITVERIYKPVPILMHASYCLRNIRAAGGKGSYYADVGALVLLAFAVEGFCQTYGPAAFGDQWLDIVDIQGKRTKRGIESKPIIEKFKLLAREAKLQVNFGQQPWKDIKRLMQERDLLAHPRPATQKAEGIIYLAKGEHPLDQSDQLVGVSWENLIRNPKTLDELAKKVLDIMEQMAEGLGYSKHDVLQQGLKSYRMAAV